MLYIFIFLHQTTTYSIYLSSVTSCISLYSYIKPQRRLTMFSVLRSCISLYSYIKPQRFTWRCCKFCVVYLYIPTSNHNLFIKFLLPMQLYIFIFLHQTTTVRLLLMLPRCCISLYSYIKPQLSYVLFTWMLCCISLYSYIKPQLYFLILLQSNSCISLYSYIKPQLVSHICSCACGCISLYSYIKPQRGMGSEWCSVSCISLYSYIKPQRESC